MGRDKALLDFLGQPLIQRVLHRVSHLSHNIFVTANHPERYHFLDIPILPDIIPGIGALGGIYTALISSNTPFVYIIACDLPFVNPDLLAACLEILRSSDSDAVIPQSENGLEPLHAIYRRDTCLPAVESAIKTGKRRTISWHKDAQIHILPPDDVLKYDPHGITFWNLNTPRELQQAKEKALEIKEISPNNSTGC
jgi:molybdopterin-guanine dinucleotide biosynthesis protein A